MIKMIYNVPAGSTGGRAIALVWGWESEVGLGLVRQSQSHILPYKREEGMRGEVR